MPISDRDVVLIDYTISTKAEGKIVETTLEEDAKAAGIYREENVYKPRVIVIGANELPQGFEEALKELDEGAEKTFEIPPEKAFGNREPGKVRVIPAREFSARGIIPRTGLEVEIRGESGDIISVGSGRVIVDFNHPLAGKNILFKVKVLKIFKESDKKVKALFLKWFRNLEEQDVKVSLSDGEALIEVPSQVLLRRDFTLGLSGFTEYIDRYLEDVKKVKLSAIIYERKQEEAAGEERPEEASEEE